MPHHPGSGAPKRCRSKTARGRNRTRAVSTTRRPHNQLRYLSGRASQQHCASSKLTSVKNRARQESNRSRFDHKAAQQPTKLRNFGVRDGCAGTKIDTTRVRTSDPCNTRRPHNQLSYGSLCLTTPVREHQNGVTQKPRAAGIEPTTLRPQGGRTTNYAIWAAAAPRPERRTSLLFFVKNYLFVGPKTFDFLGHGTCLGTNGRGRPTSPCLFPAAFAPTKNPRRNPQKNPHRSGRAGNSRRKRKRSTRTKRCKKGKKLTKFNPFQKGHFCKN